MKETEMNISKESILGDVVRGNFKTAEIFESHGIDFCCGGARTIESACAEKNIDSFELVKELEIVYAKKNGSGIFDLMPLDELINHIINVHHSFVSKMIPVISNHARKVLSAHRKNHNELEEVNNIWKDLSEELSSHLVKEEKMLFPYILNLVKTKADSPAIPIAPFGAVGNPISVMEKEHASAGEAFSKLRTVTNNYSLPSDACATFAVFYDELKEFEKDLHMHIHLENNILHPKAIMLEYELTNKKRNNN